MNENTPVPSHFTPMRSVSPPPPPLAPMAPPPSFPPQSAPADLNPVDILKPFFQYMATQQQRQQLMQQRQQQHPQVYEELPRPASPLTSATNSFNPALIQKLDEDKTPSSEMILPAPAIISQQTPTQMVPLPPPPTAVSAPPPLSNQQAPPSVPPAQQQHVTSTTTTGISFISNGLQMQFFNQQSSITTVYPPTSVQPIPTTPARAQAPPSNHQSENDLSIEVRSLAMKYLEDDQLALAIEYDRQSPTPPSTVRQSPQAFDKSMSFATQKYFEKYGIVSGSNRQQQYYISSDENDLLVTSSSPPHQRMLLPLPQAATPPIFTQPQAAHGPQAKILDLSQIRKLPKLL